MRKNDSFLTSDPLAGHIEEVEVRLIRPPRHLLRRSAGPLGELASSIHEVGLLHPIVIRPLDGKFELVAGFRRLEACKSLKMRVVPCHVVHLDEKTAFETALIENVQRRTLDPVDEARAFESYVKRYGYGSVSELASRIGKSEPYVSQRVRMLQLAPQILEKVSRRLITASHAVELLGLPDLEQTLIAERVLREKVSSKDVRRIKKAMMREVFRPNLEPAFVMGKDKEEIELERVNRLLDKCVSLFKTTLIRFDDMMSQNQSDEWIVNELLIGHRRALHKQIDELLKVRRKLGGMAFPNGSNSKIFR